MPNGVILMTALLPTKGHKYLVDFSKTFLGKGSELHVIINSRSFEPICGQERWMAFVREYDAFFREDSILTQECGVNIHHCLDDEAPQNPEDSETFWEYWADTIHRYAGRKIDYVFASEVYGIELAKSVDAKFITCDIAREIVNAKSTNVRLDVESYFGEIMPSMQKHFKQTITFFGAESTGKSTMARKFHENYSSYYTPEWAREYLETVGAEVTPEKMTNIMMAQHASQVVVGNMLDRPYVFQDTDLLSTIGYYRICGIEMPKKIIEMFNETKSNLYIMMNSNIPFEADILRYGVDKRESTDQFWISLLEEFSCKYYVVKSTNQLEQLNEIAKVVDGLWKKFEHIATFKRD